jgi:hypothetical protein
MIEPFKGTVNVDIRDSVPDWSPFEPPWAPDGAPNVVYIVLDDVGFSALGCYGGPIETPNIDQIAERGGRYTQWHTTALCSPIRSGEGGPDGSVNENIFFNGIPDDLQRNLAMIDELGGPKTCNHYCNGWAMAFNTPFKMWKRYEFNGGTRRRGPVRQRRRRHWRLPGQLAAPVHQRHHQPGRDRRQRRALPRPGTRGRGHARPGITS